MIYQQFAMVMTIDAQIAQMHQKLSQLYSERSQLLGTATNPIDTTQQTNAQAQQFFDTPKALYESVSTQWAVHNITVPPLRTLKKKLEQAVTTVTALSHNPTFTHKLTILVVPPRSVMEAALKTPAARQAAGLQNLDKFPKPSGKSQWHVIVVFDQSLRLLVPDLEYFIEQRRYMIQNFDVRGFGINDMIAAQMLHIPLIHEHYWTLFTHEDANTETVYCAQLRDGVVRFEVDDSGGILGENYIIPAVAM